MRERAPQPLARPARAAGNSLRSTNIRARSHGHGWWGVCPQRRHMRSPQRQVKSGRAPPALYCTTSSHVGARQRRCARENCTNCAQKYLSNRARDRSSGRCARTAARGTTWRHRSHPRSPSCLQAGLSQRMAGQCIATQPGPSSSADTTICCACSRHTPCPQPSTSASERGTSSHIATQHCTRSTSPGCGGACCCFSSSPDPAPGPIPTLPTPEPASSVSSI